MSSQSPFPHPWWTAYTCGPLPRCKDEWLIIELLNSIRQKPDWESKYKDPTIAEKWKNEIRLQALEKTDVVEDVLDYVFAELAWYERIQNTWAGFNGNFKVLCDDRVTISDTAVSPETKAALKKFSDQLYGSFDQLDYHPGSNDQVVDLVHPSLYCLQYGVTPIVDGESVVVAQYEDKVKETKKAVDTFGVSRNFQWLPSLMTPKDGSFEFSSYINNLHPVKYQDAYKLIAQVFNAAVPGLNFTLSRFASPEFIRIDVPEYNGVYSKEYEEKLEALEEALGKEEEETGEYDYEKLELFEDSKYDYIMPLTVKYEKDPETTQLDLKTFDNIKVIVKMANIELTPENPAYKGGSWHVEGTINEDIVATVLYYYDTENISESRLSFRCAFEDPRYEQGDTVYCKNIFGLEDGDKMVKGVGSVEAKEDRIIIFPNAYQHHVDPFELTDKTKKGYRKILCFFVCDPYNKVVVGSDKVPPQQEEWWNDESIAKDLLTQKVKDEILKVKKGTEWPVSLEGTKEVRSKLMEERTEVSNFEESNYEREFSLCEH